MKESQALFFDQLVDFFPTVGNPDLADPQFRTSRLTDASLDGLRRGD
jgi:hypothetical protein